MLSVTEVELYWLHKLVALSDTPAILSSSPGLPHTTARDADMLATPTTVSDR